MNDNQMRWQSAAFAVSLLLHAALVGWLQFLTLPRLSIPAYESRHAQPFTVKRVEITPSAARPAPGPSGTSPLNGSNQTLMPNLDRQATIVETAVQQASLANPPVPIDIPAPRLPSAAEVAIAPSASSVSIERSAVQAAITQFQNASSTNLFRFTPALPASLSGIGGGGQNGAPSTGSGGSGPYSEGAVVPSFATLIPGFHAPSEGGLNGKLPEPVLIQLPSDILFEFDSSKIKPEARALLDQALAIIRKFPRATVDILGHTDTIGEGNYNQKLSDDRALAVLVDLKQHLPAGPYNLRSRGFGKSRPLINPNGTKDEQARNRRVEVIIQALKE